MSTMTKPRRTPLPMAPHKPAPYTGPSKAEVIALRKQYLSPGLVTYYQDPLLVVEGKMQYLWDETGKQYLDAFAGIVTVSVGHCHPQVIEKVREQVGKLQHVTTIYLHPTIGLLGKKLAEKMPSGRRASTRTTTRSSACATPITAARRRQWD
jgi:alanine-glyoxylate transaminase/(R)-3-amino-2-methylpropionate-pyruvate transaminase